MVYFLDMKRFIKKTIFIGIALMTPAIAVAQGFNLKNVNPITGVQDLDDVVSLVALRLLGIAIPIASLMYIYAGILYITAAGKPDKITKAKEIFKWTTIGITIILIGGGFVDLIRSVLSL